MEEVSKKLGNILDNPFDIPLSLSSPLNDKWGGESYGPFSLNFSYMLDSNFAAM